MRPPCFCILKRALLYLLRDRSGNIALTFALIMTPLLVAVGCSLDYVRAMNVRTKLQNDLDAALIAAIKDIDTKNETELKTSVINWMTVLQGSANAYSLSAEDIDLDTSSSTIKATVRGGVPTSFLKMAGIDRVNVAAVSAVLGGTAVTTKSPLSLYLVLDQSGSMDENTNSTYTTTCSFGWWTYQCTLTYTKIAALKLAVASLMTQLSTVDPETKYVRTGAVSYNSQMRGYSDLAWGTSAALTFVNALDATGGTSSTDAFAKAYAAVSATTEATIHKQKNGGNPSRYIVFMTDGDNNNSSDDTATKQYCDKAKAAGVVIYTIALMAPAKGQALLRYCASSTDTYFTTDTASGLVAAFQSIGESSSKTMLRLTQ
ncbi:TadE/TadG family type IV pilus assembly protein [Rhizobium sp. FKL33]|uniref:vWA domain-containing protein n=1 Tax=Rhizobium sp. FKL33 TaxID=2562307 RepID=UPI0010C11DE7|nr:TadE/TadG family type IV pilus assembly protein [Rhizobium sp. FKL33]